MLPEMEARACMRSKRVDGGPEPSGEIDFSSSFSNA